MVNSIVDNLINSPFMWIAIIMGVVIYVWYAFSKIKKITIINKEKIIGEELYKSNQYNSVEMGYVIRNKKPLFKIEAVSFYKIEGIKSYKVNVQPLWFWIIPNPFKKGLVLIVSNNKFEFDKKNMVLNDWFTIENRYRLLYNLSDEGARKLLDLYNDMIDIEMLKNGFLAQIQRNAIVTMSEHLKEAHKYEEKEFDTESLKNEVQERGGNIESEWG